MQGEYRAQRPASGLLQSSCADSLSLSLPTLSPAQTHGKSGARGADLLCLLLCLLGGSGGGLEPRVRFYHPLLVRGEVTHGSGGGPFGGPGGGPGGAPGCRMCTVLRCSGPKSVAALRSLVAASWVGVEPIAMLKSTAGAESCGATSVRRVGACQCRKRRGGCGGRRRCVAACWERAVQRGR